jgi:hypothetical protein
MCYAIQENKVVKDIFMSGNSDPFEVSRFDIMVEIPGKRIRDSTAVIGDYNNDGIDELFMFILGGSRWGVSILGSYNPKTDYLSILASIDSTIIDPENGPAPVEFITYKGMQGFKIYCFADSLHVAPPKNIINDLFAWYFYAWDEAAGKYVEVEEYIEEAEYVEAKEESIEVPPEPVPPVLVPAEPLAPIEPLASREAVSGSRRPVLLVILIAGLLVFSIVTGALLLRKKK